MQLRLPVELHRALAELAHANHRTLAGEVRLALTRWTEDAAKIEHVRSRT
jgi:hypothetical protein